MSNTVKRKKRTSRKQPRLSSKHPLYQCWTSMIDRCSNPRSQAWDAYGGRGIAVDARWVKSFAAFVEDMGPKPSAKHQIDRIDNDGDYIAENCRWVLPRDNSRNRRSAVIVTTADGAMNLGDAAEAQGMPRALAYGRHTTGITPTQALLMGKSVRRTMAAKHNEPVLRLKTIKTIATEAFVSYALLVRMMSSGTPMADAIKQLRANADRKSETKRNRDQRANGIIETGVHGEQKAAARKLGISSAAISRRLAHGWTRHEALNTPSRQKPHRLAA